MQQERIKVGYVDMALGAKTVVHTYLLYTDKNNNQYIKELVQIETKK